MASVRDAALEVFAIFESLGIDYAVGGSFASSVHGVARSTQDLDIVAAILPEQAALLARALSKNFYADLEMMNAALRFRRSFNLIHLASGFKIDVFPVTSHALGAQQLKRRRDEATMLLGDPPATFPVISPEDTILVKLRWYRDGGENSERQWNDLRNLIVVQGERLDRQYLREWSETLEVADLLERLFPS